MKNAILIHGWNTKDEYYDPARPSASNDHWFPWISKQLILRDINAVSIEMPNGHYPEYDIWKKELERYEIGPDSILIGHSCGGGFLVRWLSENTVVAGDVVLVAPWLGYDVNDEPFDESFFDFSIDKNLSKRVKKLTVMVSDDDVEPIHKSVRDIQSGIDGVNIKEYSDKGHFTLSSLGGPEFPELLNEVIYEG